MGFYRLCIGCMHLLKWLHVCMCVCVCVCMCECERERVRERARAEATVYFSSGVPPVLTGAMVGFLWVLHLP